MVNEKQVVDKLNFLYVSNPKEYERYLETLKNVGYKIFRSSNGKHKIEYDTQYFQHMFGGAFAGRL